MTAIYQRVLSSPRAKLRRYCPVNAAFLAARNISARMCLAVCPAVGWAVALVAALWAGCALAQDTRKVVIPFDFESKFDEGRYGQMVGESVWKKLERQRGFIIPESMHDVRDTCRANNLKITADISLEKMQKIVTEDFGAHIGIWGSVERAPGAAFDEYDLTIKCVDFSAKPQPKVIYQKTARTNSVSEIPHLYIKEMLDALYERMPAGPPAVDAFAEENWKKNPNLVPGGDFQTAVRGVPKGWEPVGGQYREPLGRLVRWTAEEGNPRNYVIRFTFDANVGDNEGVMYYSEPFPIEAYAKYRFQCRWRSNGPACKVFIKCYDTLPTEYAAGPQGKPAGTSKGAYLPTVEQMREVYRAQMNLKGEKNVWNVHTEDFTPKHTKYTPRYGRVMLYAYLGGGVVEFDDIVLKQIVPPSPGEGKQDTRPSLATKVTDKQIEENKRRSEEAKAKAKERPRP